MNAPRDLPSRLPVIHPGVFIPQAKFFWPANLVNVVHFHNTGF